MFPSLQGFFCHCWCQRAIAHSSRRYQTTAETSGCAAKNPMSRDDFEENTMRFNPAGVGMEKVHEISRGAKLGETLGFHSFAKAV